MSKKKKDKRLSLRERAVLLKYFLKTAWREEKQVVLWLFLGRIPRAAVPFVSMVFPKLIIDELLGARRVPVLALWVLLMILAELLLRFMDRYADMRIDMGKECFSNYMQRSLSAKAMTIEFAMTTTGLPNRRAAS